MVVTKQVDSREKELDLPTLCRAVADALPMPMGLARPPNQCTRWVYRIAASRLSFSDKRARFTENHNVPERTRRRNPSKETEMKYQGMTVLVTGASAGLGGYAPQYWVRTTASSNASLVLGVAAPHGTHNSIFIAGTAGLVAGSMSISGMIATVARCAQAIVETSRVKMTNVFRGLLNGQY